MGTSSCEKGVGMSLYKEVSNIKGFHCSGGEEEDGDKVGIGVWSCRFIAQSKVGVKHSHLVSVIVSFFSFYLLPLIIPLLHHHSHLHNRLTGSDSLSGSLTI